MANLVLSIACNCSVTQLRATLQRLDNRLGSKGWIGSDGIRLVFGEYPYVKMVYRGISGQADNHRPVGLLEWKPADELTNQTSTDIKRPETRASWTVLMWRSTSMRPEYDDPDIGFFISAIEAYEESEGQTRVDFLDAYDPDDPRKECPAIGRPFEEFAAYVSGELRFGNAQRRRVLLLSADPSDASRLRLGEEYREIQEKLQLAKLRESFDLFQRTSVRPADISQALLDVNPHIVHFSGHGTSDGELCFEDELGNKFPIGPDALASLFEKFDNQISCVILNACHSDVQAETIAKHVDFVIGMSADIGDEAAIAFSVGFYQALGAGRIYVDAYELGCIQIRLRGIPEDLTPVLKTRL